MKKEIYHVISNTHWDREWYQCHEEFLVRLTELMDRLLDIMEEKPDYRFITDGQFALVEDYLEVRPENKERVKKLVEEKRLLTGPWYTQPLENIVGGEALIRNLKRGISESEKLGHAMRFSYEIDEFGHTSQLPQILAGFGIKGVMAWRGVPKNCRSYFKWASPDGTEADFFNSNAGYGEATALPDSEENFTEVIDGVPFERDGLVKTVENIRELRLKVSDTNVMMWLNGIDHSWAQEDILEIIEKINALYPELEVKQSTPDEFARELISALEKENKEPERFCGELMFTNEPVLESTNALHPRQKRRHYETEKLYVRQAEPLAEISALLGRKYPGWALERGWKYILENHAHDSLGCCSVDEVYEQVMARYGASLSIGRQIKQDSLRYIMSCSAREPSLWIFNFSEKAVKGSIKLDFKIPEGFGGDNIYLETVDGKKVEMCVLYSAMQGDVRYNPRLGHPVWGKAGLLEALVDSPEIPAFGAVRLLIKEKAPAISRQNRQSYYFFNPAGILENKNLKAEFACDGTFTLTDKRNGKVYPSQLLFTDDAEAGDCYVHVEPLNDMTRITSAGGKAEISAVYDTPLGAACRVVIYLNVPKGITADRKARTAETEKVKITSIVSLEKDADTLGIKISIDNKCENHRIRVLFPTFTDAAVSESGQAFDEVERPVSIPDDEELPEKPYLTHPMQDYCAAHGEGFGLGVSARGIYEYECTDDSLRALALTLLRSIELIDNETFQITPEYFMNEAQNKTVIEHELTLIPYNGDREFLLPRVALSLCKPEAYANRDTEDSLMPGYVHPENILGDSFKALELDGDGLAVTGFKHADGNNSLIVRVRNRTGKEVNGKLSIGIPGLEFGEVYFTDLEEKRLEKAGEGNSVEFTAKPYKLITFEFTV